VSLASNAIGVIHIPDGLIDTTQLANNSITQAKIAAGALSDALAANSITAAMIPNDLIDSDHYAAASIDNEHLADDAIDSDELAAGSIDTAHIADDQVTLAKMAGITRGSIIIGNSSGDPAALAIGTNDYVLTSDGTDIAWEAASSFNADAAQTFNDSGADVDFRIESDDNANMFFVDGGNDRVGIGTASPDQTVHVMKASAGSIASDSNAVLTIENSDTAVLQILCPEANNGYILMGNPNDGNADGRLRYNNSTREMSLWTSATERLTIDSAGKIGIGVTDPDCKLEIAGTDAMSVPSGTTAQRPTARNGMIRYNSTEDELEAYIDGAWSNVDVTVPPYSVSWLVVAGGGSGSGGRSAGSGGGGAGGYRSSYNSETSGGGASAESALSFEVGTTYTVTIGAGGAGQEDLGGLQGGNSSISGSDISTITSIGGGGGQNMYGHGQSGGSGGGGGYGGSGYAGTSGQGYAGGADLYHGGGYYGGGGGGGASEVGKQGVSSPARVAGDGGDGRASTITGSSVTYAGGGGGAERFGDLAGGSGGAGGGADGRRGNSTEDGIAATANTGGGGGAAGGDSTGQDGGAGGSGVVILRMPTGNYSGTVTGSPTVTTDGNDTIVKFTSSGTIIG